MSDDKSPVKPEPKKKTGTGIVIALLAGVLGLGAGAGLYAFSGIKDNGESSASATGCTINPALSAKLNTAATGEVAAFKAMDRAFSVADLKFNDKTGTPKTLGDWKGKTVLLNLWATWCAPCRAEMPALDALNKQLGSEKFEVVPVSVDLGTPDKPLKFYADIGMNSAGFFHDPDMATLNILKKNGLAYGLPATLLVDANSCVLGTLSGPAEWASEDAKKLVGAAL